MVPTRTHLPSSGASPLSLQAVFAVFLILQIIGLPETPRWLVAHDRHEEARAVIAAINDSPIDDVVVGRSILDIQSQLEEESKEGPFRIKEIFAWGELQNFRRLLLIISVQLGQQFSGSNMINYYLPVILQGTVGLSRNLSLILAGCAQCTYLVGSAIPVFLMDRYGRRFLLMACSAGLCLCFVMVSILLSLGTTGPAYAAVAFIFIFQLIYGVGWLPVPWFYPSELATTRVRSRMQAIASGWNWMAVFAVVKITPISFGKLDLHRGGACTCLRRDDSYDSWTTSANWCCPFQQRTSDGGHSSYSPCSMLSSFRWSSSSTPRPKAWSSRIYHCCSRREGSPVVSSPPGAEQSFRASTRWTCTWNRKRM